MAVYSFADAHCHLDSCAGILDPSILHITSGYSHQSNLLNLRIAQEHQNVYLCAGISPQEAMKHKEIKVYLAEWEEAIASKIADSGKLVAIGEIGLDYHWAKSQEERFLQHECFVSQLQLAERLSLPVVIHSRDAEQECIDILQNFSLPFMLHCYSGKHSLAEAAAGTGRALVSVPPVKSKERKRVVRALPLERLVAESDAPYLGKSPSDALASIKMIAEIKQESVEKVKAQTLLNTAQFFKIR
ncbi:MAG: TatD family hydrolase [Candidatus Micrarchaeota archaeon]|nr:TatD family hydrolase [Candidatus Micrarchaeota archaeon]